jgi:Ser/Thr protein kinase RdoA (MazF antagonist)
LNPKILKKVNSFFNIPTLSYKGKAKGGFLSDNYIVENKAGKYFLKKYRNSVGNRLPIISETEEFFANQDIPIILPFKTKTGKSYFLIDEEYYSLYPFVKAKGFDHKKDPLTPVMAKSIASNLALMHKLGRKGELHFSTERLAEWDPKKVLSKAAQEDFRKYVFRVRDAIKHKKTKTQFDLLTLKILKLKSSVADSFPDKIMINGLGRNHVIHGDYHAQNLFFNKDDQVSHVFDLEKTETRPRSTELARSMLIICFNSFFTDKQFKLAKVYLEAYKNIYPIADSEIESAIRFMFYKHTLNLWIEKGHYLNNYKRADSLLPGEFRLVDYMSKNMESFIKKLLK